MSIPPHGEVNVSPLQYSCLENPPDRGAWWAAVHGVAKSQTRLSDFIFTFHFYTLENEMAAHSSVLAWRVPGAEEPGGLPSMGSHRVGHDWSDLAAAVYLCTLGKCPQLLSDFRKLHDSKTVQNHHETVFHSFSRSFIHSTIFTEYPLCMDQEFYTDKLCPSLPLRTLQFRVVNKNLQYVVNLCVTPVITYIREKAWCVKKKVEDS